MPDYNILRAGRSVREGRNALYRQRGPVPTGQDELVGMVDSSSLADDIARAWATHHDVSVAVNDALGMPRDMDPVDAAHRARQAAADAVERANRERDKYRPDASARRQVDAIAAMLRERGVMTSVAEPVDHALRRFLRLQSQGFDGAAVSDPDPEKPPTRTADLLAEARTENAALRERLRRIEEAARQED